MEIIKKYGIKLLSAVALLALFFPMATVEVGNYASTSLSGLTVAFQGYICMLLIVGPVVIIASDYIKIVKTLKALVQCAASVLGIILTFVGYLQASNIAAASESVGLGYVECDASLGFGGILCIISYIAIIVITLLFQKDELKANIEMLKGMKG
jgi:hypothetical protein